VQDLLDVPSSNSCKRNLTSAWDPMQHFPTPPGRMHKEHKHRRVSKSFNSTSPFSLYYAYILALKTYTVVVFKHKHTPALVPCFRSSC